MKVSKTEALNIIQELYSEIPSLRKLQEGDEKCRLWKRKADDVIKFIFGENSSEYKSIHNSLFPFYIGEIDYHNNYLTRLDSLYAKLNGLEAVVRLWKDEISVNENDVVCYLIKMLSCFHRFVQQLKCRYNQRNTIEIRDEYDVQDLLHAILKLHFEDVRPEEYQPSYAGSSTRVDFFLKNENIIIEVKKTRIGLKDKELGEQLVLDREHYKRRKENKILICFIYDPDGLINNPSGLKNDLSETTSEMNTIVVISPSN